MRARQQVGTCSVEAAICHVVKADARPSWGLSGPFLQIVSVIWREINTDPVSAVGKAPNVLHCLNSAVFSSELGEMRFRLGDRDKVCFKWAFGSLKSGGHSVFPCLTPLIKWLLSQTGCHYSQKTHTHTHTHTHTLYSKTCQFKADMLALVSFSLLTGNEGVLRIQVGITWGCVLRPPGRRSLLEL